MKKLAVKAKVDARVESRGRERYAELREGVETVGCEIVQAALASRRIEALDESPAFQFCKDTTACVSIKSSFSSELARGERLGEAR